MTRRSRRRKIRTAREAEFVVRVCRHRALLANVISFIAALIFGGLGVWQVVEGRLIAGVFVLLVFCVVPVTFSLMWRREVGNIVLEFRPDGLKYYERLLPWEQIHGAEVIRRRRRATRIVLTMNDERTVSIIDDYLDRSVDELCREISKRCGATG